MTVKLSVDIPYNPFFENDLECFIERLAATVISHNITVQMIERCLPFMGEMRDHGWNPEEILAEALMSHKCREG